MEDNNNQQYITREVFDANILAIREAIAASEARCERIAAELRTDFQAKSDEMRENYKVVTVRLDSIDKRIDNIERSIDSLFTKLSLVFTGLTLIFTAIQYFLR